MLIFWVPLGLLLTVMDLVSHMAQTYTGQFPPGITPKGMKKVFLNDIQVPWSDSSLLRQNDPNCPSPTSAEAGFDMNATFSDGVNWDYNTDANAPIASDAVSFVTVALHELIHGLGENGDL